ncbi:hypothetical protein F2Q70_00003072 [Brassica cretica]|uniref:Uncharacterized protein n=2 Tax=Brassica cretica TaxID=69181 RepID=A0A3N6QG79_BRACR|nr:hypothetical protein F2Q68_00020734 [Brassica cretica]KAF2571360.1 hypothetical protein F2Q70_00003072 [Brassica cretica]KAF3568468.1 hypothetical protein DY000_02014763 [Brassica cretica]
MLKERREFGRCSEGTGDAEREHAMLTGDVMLKKRVILSKEEEEEIEGDDMERGERREERE